MYNNKLYKDPAFCARKNPQKDTFEKSDGLLHYQLRLQLNLMERELVDVTQHPLDKAVIYKKVINSETGKLEKIPYVVDIAKSEDGSEKTFYFLKPETKEELGFVVINNLVEAVNDKKTKQTLLNLGFLDNYPEEGIVGERITIEYLHNNDDVDYCGVGRLADQIAIEYCLREGIEPNIISFAAMNSHAAHYKRGRRFFKIGKDSFFPSYYDFKLQYGTNDPNEVIRKRISETPDGEQVYCEDLGPLLMYMPKETVDKYMKIIKQHPILH